MPQIKALKQNDEGANLPKSSKGDYVNLGEWFPIVQGNQYIVRHLLSHPQKIAFGTDENDTVYVKIDK